MRAQLKRASRIGRELSDTSQRQLALSLDTKRVVVAHFELEHQPRVPNAEHLSNPNAPRAWRMEVLRTIAESAQAQIVDRAEVTHGDNHAARLASLTVELSDVLRTHALALVDGAPSDTDLETLQRESREAVATLLELDAYCAQTLSARRAGRAG